MEAMSSKECQKVQFIVKNGDCECPSGEQMIISRCHKFPDNCLRLTPNLTCKRCESEYRFDRGDCVSNSRLTFWMIENIENNIKLSILE